MSHTEAARMAWHGHQNEAQLPRPGSAPRPPGCTPRTWPRAAGEGPAQPGHAGQPQPAEDWTAEAHDAYERHRGDRQAPPPCPWAAAMTALATALLAWWALAPWATLATGWRRGHPLAGWRCGLVPLIGPALARACHAAPVPGRSGEHELPRLRRQRDARRRLFPLQRHWEPLPGYQRPHHEPAVRDGRRQPGPQPGAAVAPGLGPPGAAPPGAPAQPAQQPPRTPAMPPVRADAPPGGSTGRPGGLQPCRVTLPARARPPSQDSYAPSGTSPGRSGPFGAVSGPDVAAGVLRSAGGR